MRHTRPFPREGFVCLPPWVGLVVMAWLGAGWVSPIRGAAPPVAHVTVVAKNPVEGLRALAAQRDGSYQVFLWRADAYLKAQFREASFADIKKALEDGGAEKLVEGGEEPEAERHLARYRIQKNVIRSRLGKSRDCILEVTYFRKEKATKFELSIEVEYGLPFKEAAARRDYAKGTVLDRIFGLSDLEQSAKETPYLEKIEIRYGPIVFINSPSPGSGFFLEVSMSNPEARGRLADQRIYYMACSGLDPVRRALSEEGKPFVQVARDILIPGACYGSFRERGYENAFGSFGRNQSPRAGAPKEAP